MPSPRDPITDLSERLAETRRELLETRQRLQRLEDGAVARAPRQRAGWRRWAAAAMTVAVIVVMPMAAIGSDTFTDVPDSHPFHGDINRLYGSRITAGCGGGNFCPDTAVTRGQMAAFLNRGLGRLGGVGLNSGIDGLATGGTFGSLAIRANNVTGGTAFVQVIASIDLYVPATEIANCECEFRIWLADEADAQVSNSVWIDVDDIAISEDNDRDVTATLLAFQQVPTGVTKTYHVAFDYLLGTADATVVGFMVATTYVFGPTGGNTLSGQLDALAGAKAVQTEVK